MHLHLSTCSAADFFNGVLPYDVAATRLARRTRNLPLLTLQARPGLLSVTRLHRKGNVRKEPHLLTARVQQFSPPDSSDALIWTGPVWGENNDGTFSASALPQSGEGVTRPIIIPAPRMNAAGLPLPEFCRSDRRTPETQRTPDTAS